ncbi:MAG: hypothetical protein IKE69_13880 [Thermoguttaceae bacterium]|nr:hypothetical protein [Thermoguttaceae bacterium]
MRLEQEFPDDDYCLSGLFVPAVNELRYAGWHIAKYIDEKDPSSIGKAVSHCLRAEYDAYDCGIQFFLGECRSFQIDYKRIPISSVIPGYNDIVVKLNQIAQNPATRDNAANRVVSLKKEEFESLADIYTVFQAARDELNKIGKNNSRKNFWLVLSVAVSVVSAVAAVATFFCACR